MVEELIDGILEAIRLGNWEHCVQLRDKALDQLGRQQANSRRERISELTRQIFDIDRLLCGVERELQTMPLSPGQKDQLAQDISRPFLMQRRELVARKGRVAVGRAEYP